MSLRNALQQTIINNIINKAMSKMKTKHTAIIADDTTISILDRCFTIHELNDLNIGLVLNIKYTRQRMKISPIYFISPNKQSIQQMCNDYSNINQPTYSQPVHIFFHSDVSVQLIQIIKKSTICNYIETLSVVYCNFLTLQQRVFLFNRGYKSFRNVYIDKQNRFYELNIQAEQLVSVCCVLLEEPIIECCTHTQNEHIFQKIFQQKFKKATSLIHNWKPQGRKCKLLIIDRMNDPLIPLLHDLSFQGITADLLHNDIIEKSSKESEYMNKFKFIQSGKNDEIIKFPIECIFDDAIGVKYNRMFIGDVAQKLPADFTTYTQNYTSHWRSQKYSSKNIVSQNIKIWSPCRAQIFRQYSGNINIASKIQNDFRDNNLREVVSCEQDLCTLINEYGKKVTKITLHKSISELLTNSEYDQTLKLRLIMMYAICEKCTESQLRKLVMNAGLDESIMYIILNVSYVGIDIMKTYKCNWEGMTEYNDRYWPTLLVLGFCRKCMDDIPVELMYLVRSFYYIKTKYDYWKMLTQIARSKVETTDIIRYTSYLQHWLRNNVE
eukprot:126551_1